MAARWRLYRKAISIVASPSTPAQGFPIISLLQSSVVCVVRVTRTSLALDPSLALSLLNIVANEHWTVKTIFIDVFAQPL